MTRHQRTNNSPSTIDHLLARTIKPSKRSLGSSRTPRKLRLETLENRQLMAGDGMIALHEITSFADSFADAHADQVSALTLSFQSPALQGEGEPPIGGAASDDLVAFAKALTAAGAVLYGAGWDATTNQQRNLFEDGGKHLPFVDVTNSDHSPNELATDNNIAVYPTWIFSNGNRLEGVQTLAMISLQADLAIPQSASPYIEPLEDVNVGIGSPLHIPIDAYHPNGTALTITVSSDKPGLVTAEVLRGNRNLLIETDFGDMNFQLFEDKAPRVTQRVIELAEDAFYDGLLFHRVIENFMIQGGDPLGNGTGGSDLGNFDDQFHLDLQHNRPGVLSFAKSNDDTNNSQFFITAGPTRHLDFNHSVFGQMIEGDWVHESISGTETGVANKPTHDVVMKAVNVFTDTENGVILLKATGTGMGTANITVTVSDGATTVEHRFAATVVADTANGAPFLNDIPDQQVLAGATLTFSVTSQDAENDPVVYGVQPLGPVDFVASVNPQTGVINVTPPIDFEGTLQLGVWVQQTTLPSTSDRFDTQIVEIEVSYPNWQNPRNPLDVNDDRRISAVDALQVINYLNTSQPRDLRGSGYLPPPYVDVTGDQRVSAQDALLVINYLNLRSSGGGGRGEGEGSVSSPASNRETRDLHFVASQLALSSLLAEDETKWRLTRWTLNHREH